MFTRNSDRMPPPIEQGNEGNSTSAPTMPSTTQTTSRPMSTGPRVGSGNTSVISKDLTILGSDLRIVSRGTVNIEGRIMGDVIGAEILIGEEADVSGMINADQIVVRGTVNGTIKAVTVTLASTAKVDGEINHQSLAIEQGALFEGKSRRAQDVDTLRPDFDQAASAPVIKN